MLNGSAETLPLSSGRERTQSQGQTPRLVFPTDPTQFADQFPHFMW
jgi:hypothetical protein